MTAVSNRFSLRDETKFLGSAIAGDSASFHILYKHYFDPLLERMTAELCNNNFESGRDVLQQAFLDVYHNLHDIDRAVPFSESIMNAARDRMISRNHDEKTSLYDFLSLAETALKKTAAADADPAEIMAKRQALQQGVTGLEALFAINSAADEKLARGIRYLFALHHDGETLAEIAAREKKSVNAVEESIKNACTLLRPVLGPLME